MSATAQKVTPMSKETFLVPGVAHERSRRPGEVNKSIESIVRNTMNECGYPCATCEPGCSTADLCATLARYGCTAGGGATHVPATVTDSSTINFTASGTDNQTFTGSVIPSGLISTDANNDLTIGGDGLLHVTTPGPFQNGLSLAGTAVELGGSLLHNTTVDGGDSFGTTFDNQRQFLIVTGRTPAVSEASVRLGSDAVTGVIVNHTDVAGGQLASNFTLNHTIANIFEQRNGVVSSTAITQSGASSNTPYTEINAITTVDPAKIFTVRNTGYFMTNVEPATVQTDVLYHDPFTGQIFYGPAPASTTYTFTNGLTEAAGTVSLGGTLTGSTTITAPGTFDFVQTKDNVSYRLDNNGFASFGTGESVSFIGSDGTVSARTGVYTDAAGVPSTGSHLYNTPSDVFQLLKMDSVLDMATLRVGTVGVNKLTHMNLFSRMAEFGFTDNTTSTTTALVVEEVTAPAAAVVIKAVGLQTFANDAAAAAALPSKSLWVDGSNFIKIVP